MAGLGDLGGLGDLADKGLGKLEEGVEWGKHKVGEGVDWGTEKVGAGLDHVGAGRVGDVVEAWGDRKASSLGVDIPEKQLGQTEDPRELVHGDAGKIRGSTKHLTDFKAAFDRVGDGMKQLDSSHWKGEAAETFRAKFAMHPKDWRHAADACGEAAAALEGYADAVLWAQGQAREAMARYRSGKDASAKAVEAYNKRVDTYNAAIKADTSPGPKPEPFKDPGVAEQENAQELLKEARRQRDNAGEAAKKAVAAAMAHAPAEPPATSRALANVADASMALNFEASHVGAGAIKGTAGLLNFVRAVNPMDVYNLTHPAEYNKNLNLTLNGLASSAAHPDRTLKTTWETLKADPSEFGGRLLPEALGSKGLGMGRGLVTKLPLKPPSPGRHGPETHPNGPAIECSAKKCALDPIDVATGRMLLPQTDIVLPGSLPLSFERIFESSYRAGRWFGPAWASTADQRLEIDSQGVIFAREDGSLLAYPHPAPGVPVMPTHGQRWPLDRELSGYTVTNPESGQVWHFADHGDDSALLKQIDDRNGRWIAYEHDEAGAPTSIVHHGGYHLKLTTDQSRITALHLAGAAADGTDQEILRYGYTDGHLTEVTNSSGIPLRFGYDEHGRITSWTDTNGSHFDYVYDEHHRCTSQSGTNGHLNSRLAYDTDPESGLQVTAITDSLGHTSRFLVNEAVQVVAEIDPAGAVTRFEWDRYNRLLSVTDPLGHTGGTTYNASGHATSATRPDGRQATSEYDAQGLPVRVTGPDGMVVRQVYDDRGNRVSVTGPSNATMRFAYDETGHVTSVRDALGHSTGVRCDESGMPAEVTDPLGARTHYVRDAFGRPIAITNQLGATKRLEWTVEGKLARRTEPDGSTETWTYDGEGNCVAHTNAVGEVTSFEYSDFDLLAARIGPDGVRHAFTHNSNLQLTQVTNPQGLTWDYVYGSTGRLASETDFDGRTLTYEYDAAGRLAARRNGLGQVIRFERNALGQIVRKDAEGAVTTHEYDIFDHLARATGPDATLTRLRDRTGLLRSETVNGRTTTFAYDALARRIGRTTPTGAASTWSYDAAGSRTQLTTSGRSLTFERDALGQELTRRVGDTVTLSHAFDARGRLTDQQVAGNGASLQRRTYTYRPDGNLTGIDDQLSGSRRFDLDTAGRVTAVHATNWSERYAYDEAGNQTEASWPTTHPGQEATGARAYRGTDITRAGNVRYEHDAQGRTVLRQKTRLSRKPDTWRYSWDAEDRLISLVTPDNTVWRYLYDPLGRRIAKQRLGNDPQSVVEQTNFTWDAATLCEQTTVFQGLPHLVALTWDHDGPRPLAQTERVFAADAEQSVVDERFFAVVTDLVGSPSELIDEAGVLAWRSRSTLWGYTTWTTTSTAYTPLRFPGQYFDPETELHYNFHRHYDPEVARYTSLDPLGLYPAPNPATYVANPHISSDPLGLSPCPPRSKAEARATALRDAGIPEGTMPFDSNDYVKATGPAYAGGKQLRYDNGEPIFYREEWFEAPGGDIVVYQDHHFGHQKPGEPGHQPAHVHVRPYDNTRNGQLPGCEEHYPYDPSLG